MTVEQTIEQTLAIIKPDAVTNKNIGKIIQKIEENNFNIQQIFMIQLTKEEAGDFYYAHKDKGFFNVDNSIKFSEYLWNNFGLNIPVCYDNLHDFCNPSEVISIKWQAERCAYTWVNQNSTIEDESHFLAPVFHWSEGKPEKPRSHADYFAFGNTPPVIAIEPNKEAKWECEVKGKDKAIRLLRKNLINA